MVKKCALLLPLAVLLGWTSPGSASLRCCAIGRTRPARLAPDLTVGSPSKYLVSGLRPRQCRKLRQLTLGPSLQSPVSVGEPKFLMNSPNSREPDAAAHTEG